MRECVYSTLVHRNGWSEYDIRQCRMLSYEMRPLLIKKYLTNSRLRISSYCNRLGGIEILSKKWWVKKAKSDINVFPTFQKTLTNPKIINKIIRKALESLPTHILDQFDVNVYYKYQRAVSSYICSKHNT